MIKYEPYQASNVLFRYEKPDPFYKANYSLNPYRGCPVGCRYCYIQNKKHISAGLEEEKDSIVQVKINLPYLLKKRLDSGPEPGLIAVGESCEPYADIESKYFITRRILEILSGYEFPVHIITRFDRILRDIDIIEKINLAAFISVTVSIPVISKELVQKLEGKTPSIKERLKIFRVLRRKGISAGVALAPVIPYISDGAEVGKVMKKAAAAGASYALFRSLRIKDYQRDMFFSWLKEKYPRLIDSYERLYSESEEPSEEYRVKFYEQFCRTAELLGLLPELPVKKDFLPAYNQELLNFND